MRPSNPNKERQQQYKKPYNCKDLCGDTLSVFGIDVTKDIHNLCATNARQKLQLGIDAKASHTFSQPEMWHHQVQASGVTLMNRNLSVTALFVPIGYLFYLRVLLVLAVLA